MENTSITMLSLGCTLLGVLITRIWTLAVESTRIRGDVAKAQRDVNGVGDAVRSDRGTSERRWKHMIATQIETSATLEEAKIHAKLLREDAWR